MNDFYFLSVIIILSWILVSSVITFKEFRKLARSIPFPDIHLSVIYAHLSQAIACAIGGIGLVFLCYYMKIEGIYP